MREEQFRNDILPLKDRIFRLALHLTLNREEAEDIVQETLLKVWQKRDEWAHIANMEAYCLTICRHLALDHQRRQTAGRETPVGDFPPSMPHPDRTPDELLDQQQRIEAVREIIGQLPEVQRTIIELRDIEGLRYDEIAQVTGLSETQVKVYLHRARTKIKEKFTRQL
ncbi:MAG: RNA polymerase sigma factor [Bacteroidaceae bacterium]|nr:RNA polymerase sigma factor [Bacteroidaceae bacterium]